MGSGGAPTFTGASFGITASFPFLLATAAALPHVHGLSPARSTTTAPSRPDPIGRRRAQPDTRVGSTTTRQDQGGSRVHCDSLDEGGAQLCPCGLATATPQHITVASRTATHMTIRKFPVPIHRHGCAPRPAHIRQV
jgi:hypothetical protein